MDHRPKDCQFRLQDEGKGYPRSACTACGKTVATGLGRRCTQTENAGAEQATATVQVGSEFYVGGVRYDAGEYIIKRIGPAKPDPTF